MISWALDVKASPHILQMDRNFNIPSYCNLNQFLTALEVACSCSLCINHEKLDGFYKCSKSMDISRVCESEMRRLWHYLGDLISRVLIPRTDGINQSFLRTMSFHRTLSSFDIMKRKTYHTYNMLQTFLLIGYFSSTVFTKKANSFQTKHTSVPRIPHLPKLSQT